MDIYFDSRFIQELNKDIYDPQRLHRRGMRRLMDLFEDYVGICVYSNLRDAEIISNYVLQKLLNNNGIHDTEEIFKIKLKSRSVSAQMLAFFGENHDVSLLKEIQELGGLCFTSSNYLDEVERFLSYEKPVYLKYGDTLSFSWNELKDYGFETDSILLIDKYLLSNETKACEHFMPMLKGLFVRSKSKRMTIISCSDTGVVNTRVRELINKFCDENSIDKDLIEIISFDPKSPFNFHDRYLFSRYVTIDAGRGFDNLFKRYYQRSDAKLKIRTIFTQETYNDFRQLIPTYQAYIEWHNLSKNNRYSIPFKSLG
jgi:hypothetical protein